MQYEVEQKFAVADMAELEARLSSLGGVPSAPRWETDQYYNHPARDFAVTDEALRIRRIGDSACLTYKGPKIDATTKTRRELEIPLEAGDLADWIDLFQTLGFRPVGEVRKRRRKVFVAWQQRRVEVSLDEVDDVGQFVELELIAGESEVAAARDCLAALAQRLALGLGERRSYLELKLRNP
jgi:adenylate cyclase class 2